MSFIHDHTIINLHDDVIDAVTETCDWFVDLRLKILFGDLRSRSDRGNHVISETGRTVTALESRTDPHTVRRHEANPAKGDSDSDCDSDGESGDVGGEPRNQGRARDPECGSPGDGSSNGSVCCGGLGMTGPAAARCDRAQVADTGSGGSSCEAGTAARQLGRWENSSYI